MERQTEGVADYLPRPGERVRLGGRRGVIRQVNTDVLCDMMVKTECVVDFESAYFASLRDNISDQLQGAENLIFSNDYSDAFVGWDVRSSNVNNSDAVSSTHAAYNFSSGVTESDQNQATSINIAYYGVPHYGTGRTANLVTTTAANSTSMVDLNGLSWTGNPLWKTGGTPSGAGTHMRLDYSVGTWRSNDPATRRPEKTAAARLAEMFKKRMAPTAHIGRSGKSRGLSLPSDFREARARETLSVVLGAEKFQRFQRDGFITARGKSGRTYQIFPGDDKTNVYVGGVLTEKLCVVLAGSFPPTDSLIVRFLMIVNDEDRFLSLAIKHRVSLSAGSKSRQESADYRPLAELLADYRHGNKGSRREASRAAVG